MKKMHYVLMSGGFLLLGFFIPWFFEGLLVNMIVDVRTAIVSGDSGHLILTGFAWTAVTMAQNLLIITGMVIMVDQLVPNVRTESWLFILIQLFFYSLVTLLVDEFSLLSIETTSNLLAGMMTLTIISFMSLKQLSTGRNVMITLQVFFGFGWLNLMPGLSRFGFGRTDLPASIKVAAIYLGSESVLNFIGLAFFAALLISALMTYWMYNSYDHHISVAKENYERAIALESIRQKAVQNRAYEEIHAITHDLKTPLVTIRGLNSLLAMSKDPGKTVEYTERVDGAVTKMTDMISSFLYESNKQIIRTEEIIDHVRAQIPVENEEMQFHIDYAMDLPSIYVNKIRFSRALINILENAITAPTHEKIKVIRMRVYQAENQIVFDIRDNGVGIDKERIEKIWEIGYSTKATTGLGLAFVKKVVEDNGGTLLIDSVVDKGTQVSIKVPVSQDHLEERV